VNLCFPLGTIFVVFKGSPFPGAFTIHNSIYQKPVNYGVPIMNNERYIDFLKFALHRIIETALLYESQAKICKDSKNKLFLYYLAGKKRVQHVVLEMLATNNREKPISFNDYNNISISDEYKSVDLINSTPEAILRFANSRAEKDLSLYISLAALEEDDKTKKLLVTLSKLSKDFIQDISAGYSKFTMERTKFSSYSGPEIRIRKKLQENTISS